MANKYWTPLTEKIVISISLFVLGYMQIQPLFLKAYPLPSWIMTPIAGITLLTLAGVGSLYAIYMLWFKY